MRRLSFAVTALAFAGLAGVATADLPRAVVQRVKDSTVFIEVENRAGGNTETSTGSGFVYDSRGLVLTNQHVVDNRMEARPNRFARAESQTIRVYFYPATPQERVVEATLERAHAGVDLAILRLPPGTYPALEFGDADALYETQTIYAAGHPLGLEEISIRTGSVTAKRILDGEPYIEHSVNVEHGNSGGPLFDDQGRVLGVVCFTLSAAEQNTNFAIPTSTIQRFLRDEVTEPLQASGTDAAFLEALLEDSGLKFNEVPGMDTPTYSLPYEDCVVFVRATENWVMLQVLLGSIEGGTRSRAELYAFLLEKNYQYYIGKFGLDEDGDLWLEHHAYRGDISGEGLAMYASTLADFAAKYENGNL